jgi:nucleoside-diphosphate-sugar epimerase
MEHQTPREMAQAIDALAEQTQQSTPQQRVRRRGGGAPVLVTGATGGTGTYVLRELARRGVSARAMVRDRAAASALAAPFSEIAFGDLAAPRSLERAAAGTSAIVHAACTYVNPAIDIAAMETLATVRQDRPFVYVSSVDVYGGPTRGPVREDYPVSGSRSAYAAGKVAAEEALCGEAATSTAVTVLRPPFIWGEHSAFRGQLAWGATSGIYQAVCSGQDVVLPGRRGEYGDAWVDVRALAWVIAEAITSTRPLVANVVSGEFSWGEFAENLIVLLGADSAVRYDSNIDAASKYATHWRYDTARLRRAMPTMPAFTLEETMRALLDVDVDSSR